jgi:hypothetical protein
MATITTEVDVDLDEFDLDELLEEIEYRYWGSDKVIIDEWASNLTNLKVGNLSILDDLKILFLKNNLDKITLNELENLIK